MQSEQIGELAAALALAQGEILAPKKGRTAQIKSDKGNYQYSYADLSDVIECYRKPLSANGLSVTQTMRIDGGHLILVTTLIHKSGQWKDSEYPLQAYNRPQEQGSAITYARRYAVTALLGIAAEDDDDGNAAENGASRGTDKASKPAAAPAAKASALTRQEIESVHTLAKKAGYKSVADLAPVLHNICGVNKASELSKGELAAVLEALAGIADHKAAEVPA